MARKILIAGNWKMNKTAAEGTELAKAIVSAAGKTTAVEIVVCPTFTALESVSKVVEGSAIKLGAQNMHPEASAPTPARSRRDAPLALLLYVILGHSERRTYLGESMPSSTRRSSPPSRPSSSDPLRR
jgi:triosephosphate isomerase